MYTVFTRASFLKTVVVFILFVLFVLFYSKKRLSEKRGIRKEHFKENGTIQIPADLEVNGSLFVKNGYDVR